MYVVQYTRRTSCFSLGLGLAVSIFQFWNVYHTVAQEGDRGSRCGLLTITLARNTKSFLCTVRYTFQNWKISTANPNNSESHDLIHAQLYDIQSNTGDTDC